MNKVGIVTFHKSFSYGARLQAIATEKIITKLGYDCEFVDYANEYEVNSYKGKNYLIRLKNVLIRKDYWLRQAFEDYEIFYNGKVSKCKYTNINEMKDVKYDSLVAGSDQIWNPNITGGLDLVYLLDFGRCNNKISYASSMGSYAIAEKEKKMYAKCINEFSNVSVREEFAKKELSDVIKKDIEIVVDPTMLMTRDDWNEVIEKQTKRYENIVEKEYVLCFFVGGKVESYSNELKKVKEKLGLPMYNIQMSKLKHKNIDKPIAGATVADFVNLIKNASLVITDSFHGTVFSLLYQKKFLPLINKSNPVRVRELLKYLEIEEIYDNVKSIDDELEYAKITEKIELRRKASTDWLKKALKGE